MESPKPMLMSSTRGDIIGQDPVVEWKMVSSDTQVDIRVGSYHRAGAGMGSGVVDRNVNPEVGLR